MFMFEYAKLATKTEISKPAELKKAGLAHPSPRMGGGMAEACCAVAPAEAGGRWRD